MMAVPNTRNQKLFEPKLAELNPEILDGEEKLD